MLITMLARQFHWLSKLSSITWTSAELRNLIWGKKTQTKTSYLLWKNILAPRNHACTQKLVFGPVLRSFHKTSRKRQRKTMNWQCCQMQPLEEEEEHRAWESDWPARLPLCIGIMTDFGWTKTGVTTCCTHSMTAKHLGQGGTGRFVQLRFCTALCVSAPTKWSSSSS